MLKILKLGDFSRPKAREGTKFEFLKQKIWAQYLFYTPKFFTHVKFGKKNLENFF